MFSGDITKFARRALSTGLGSTEQNLSVTDIISEGPIGGLVFGGRSIFLNDDALFDDTEVGFTSTAGMTINGANDSGVVSINNYDGEEFDYAPSSEAKRFLLVHDLFTFSGSGYTYSSESGVADATAELGFELKINGDFLSIPNIMVAGVTGDNLQNPYTTIVNGNFVDQDAIVTVWNKTKDRFVEGMLLERSDDQITVVLKTNTIEDSPWLETSELKVHFSQLLEITSISTNSINIKTTLTASFTKKFFSISKPVFTTNVRAKKYRSSGYQFRSGTLDQKPITSLTGGVGAGTVALNSASTAELNVGVVSSIVSTIDAAEEIDVVRLIFRYNSGLFSLDTDNGNKSSAGAGYVIRLQTQAENGVFIDQKFLPGTLKISSSLRNSLTGAGEGAAIGATGVTDSGLLVDFDLPRNQDGSKQLVDVLAVDTPVFHHGGKHLSAVTFTHTIDLTPFQPFSGFKIQICRITNNESNTDTSTGRAHNAHGLQFISEDIKKHQGVHSGGVSNAIGIITDKLNYPFTALSEVTFNTRQFSSMPSRNYEIYGLKVKIPSNYTTREEFGNIQLSDLDNNNSLIGNESVGSLPEGSRLYNGFFTGSFREERVYTDNPAWVFYDMVTNNRYGAGEYVKDFDIDKFSLYKIARYCDELVSDGKGNFEPRFRANIYIAKATDIYKVLKDMATIFRGMLYWMDGKLLPVIDEKKAAVYNFNKSNVLDGQFNFEYAGSKTRKNQLAVSWNNPQNEYKLESLFVEDRENIVKTGKIVKGTAVAFGCTSEGQAIRYGRWKLFTAINQTEVCSFTTAINAAFLAPGDIVNIQDNHDTGFAFGGRLSNVELESTTNGVETTKITLDRSLAKNAAGTADAAIGAAGEYKLALLLAEEAFIAEELIQITSRPDVTPGNAITEWRLYLPGPPTTTPRVKIVENQAARDNLSGNVTGDFAYQLDTKKLYSYELNSSTNEESYIEDTQANKLDMLVASAVDKQNRPVRITHTTSTRIKEIDCLEGNDGSTNTLGKILTTSDLSATERNSALAGRIWAAKDNDSNLRGSYKPYKILAISYQDNKYEITAVEYFDVKFDAIETDFTTAIDDPVFPTETDRAKINSPRGLRASKTTSKSGGETVILEWTAPIDGENVKSYEVTAEIPGFATEQITALTSVEFVNVPSGTYVFEVRALDGENRVSKPASLEVTVGNSTTVEETRIFGILKGGFVSAKEIIINTIAPVVQKFKFGTDPVFFRSYGDDSTFSKSISLGEGLDFSILGAYTDNSVYPWQTATQPTLAKTSAYIVFRNYSTGTKSLRLANYVEDNALGVSYWYDQTKQTQKKFNENTADSSLHFGGSPDVWEQLTGKVIIDNETSKVIGTGTYFLSNLTISNVLKFSESFGAKIVSIESDTVLYIDKITNYKTHVINGVEATADDIVYTSPDHTFVVGDDVSISGLAPASYNTPTSLSHAKEKVTAVTTLIKDNVDVNATSIVVNRSYEITSTGTTDFTLIGAANSNVGTKFVATNIGSGNGIVRQTVKTFTIKNNTSASGVLTDATGSATTAIGTTAQGGNFFKDELQLDPSFDFTLGKINDSGVFFRHLNPPDEQIAGKGLFVDGTVAAINYSGATGNSQTSTFPAGGLFITATSIGYINPEFRVQGAGFTETSVNADGDTAFTNPSNGILNKQIHDNTAIDYSNGTALEFIVTVREAGDPDNTAQIVSKTFNIVKIKDGASGSQGRTVSLESLDDTTVLYDKNKATPNFTDNNGDGDLDFQAVAFNFGTNPLFRFTEDGTAGNWDTVSTKSITVPANFSSSMTKKLKVEVADQPSGWTTSTAQNVPIVAASDTVPINKFFEGQDVLEIDMPNNTVGVDADSQGSFSDITVPGDIPGTGATMEVINNGTVATYVGVTSGAQVGKANASTALAANEWYIESVTDSDANIEAGNITGVSSNVVSIGPVRLINSQTTSGLNERITWTIRIKRNASDSEVTKTVSQTLFKTKAGPAGAAIAELYYRNNASTGTGISAPTSATFNFSNLTLGGTLGQWETAQPSPTSTAKFVWKISATVSDNSSGSPVEISQNAWTTPSLVAQFSDAGTTASAANQSFTFISNAAGVVSDNTFTSTLNIRQGTQVLTFASLGTVVNTYGVTFPSSLISNCVPNVGAGGVLSIAANSTILDAGDRTANFTAVITDLNTAQELTRVTYFLQKIEQTVRDGGTFIKHGATEANAFKNTLSTAAAQEAAAFVMANSVDGFISQNDRVTLVGIDSQYKPISATRIYVSSTRRNSASLFAISGNVDEAFGSVVASHIEGSAIVDGTLSANKLTANTVLTNGLEAQSTIKLASGGKLFGGDKESGFTDTDPGFHLDSDGNVNIGNATNFLKFYATGDDTVTPAIAAGSFQLQGNVTLQGPPGADGLPGDVIDSAAVDNFNKLILTVTQATGRDLDGTLKTQTVTVDAGNVVGPASSAFYTIPAAAASGTRNNLLAPTNAEIHVATGRDDGSTDKGFPVKGDSAIVINTTVTPNTSKGWNYNGTEWEEARLFISGDVIVEGSISSNELAANSVKASQLEISNAAAGNSGIYFDNNNNNPRIDIYDGSSPAKLRVRLGYLGT